LTEVEQISEASEPLRRAGLMRRLAALLYDSFLVVAVWFVIAFMLQRIVGTQSNKLIDGVVQTDPLLDALLFTIMVTSGSGFYIWFWTKSGQTLGMIAWRIKLESLDGGLINFKQGMIRYIAAWPAFFLLGLGYLSIYLDSNGDAAHDKVSRSKVVVLPKSHRPFD
tara:strand:- start:1063 stop:1560 length:498 start_codon:yes stop_codon:yes gene_type:complete